ncbi:MULTISPECIES: hypothetical protein [unclassified Streptomyces]|uniref:hypothetical protein n=1 Tax=unclassified Streptomyces TaxID=2593676 RepID=UPI0037FCB0D6
MAVDPTDPDTFETDTFETADETTERSAEIPEADAAEQKREARRRDDEPLPRIDPDRASEGDAFDQARTVDLGDEDDYRP